MVYGELGRYPIDIDIKVRTISYWARLNFQMYFIGFIEI